MCSHPAGMHFTDIRTDACVPLVQVFLAMLLCGWDVSSTGLLVAKKDLSFVVRAMTITCVLTSSTLVAVRVYGWGLHGVWCAMAGVASQLNSAAIVRRCMRRCSVLLQKETDDTCAACRWGLCLFFALRSFQSVPRLLTLFPSS